MKFYPKASPIYMVGTDTIDAGQAVQKAVSGLPKEMGGGASKTIINSRHPDYVSKQEDWKLFRDAWTGGQTFVNDYLCSFSVREENQHLSERRKITYCPAIAKGAVSQIKNAIAQRMTEVTRKNGTESYTAACQGDKWGVDKLGSSMNKFVGKEVLPELLAMGKVGVYIDRPYIAPGFTQYDTINKRPYVYTYKCEDIMAWVPDDSSEPNEFSVLLLRENYLETDVVTGLPTGWCQRFRYMQLNRDAKTVIVKFYNLKGEQINVENQKSNDEYAIYLQVIPFVVFELSESLLTDVAMYQVALLNLGSSDLTYALKANFPFYTEQYDPKSEAGPYKTGNVPVPQSVDAAIVNQTRQNISNDMAKEEIDVGVSQGRRYPKGTERPDFIHPSPEPIVASMSKQSQLKGEIKEILSLWLSNVTAGSVDKQTQDDRQGLESGLNNIGMELEYGERKIGTIWSMYEGKKKTDVAVSYPNTYSIKSDKERREEAKEINELSTAVPSILYQKESKKQQVLVLFQGKLPQEQINKINKEIDDASTMTCNYEEIKSDVELGLCGQETASIARGYPKGEVEKAKKDQADRLALVQAAQSAEGALKNPAARGITDKAVAPASTSQSEKKVTADPINPQTKRGEGK